LSLLFFTLVVDAVHAEWEGDEVHADDEDDKKIVLSAALP